MPNLDTANLTFGALKIVAGRGVTVGPSGPYGDRGHCSAFRMSGFDQLCAAVRLARGRVAKVGAFESALDVSLRAHGLMLIGVDGPRSGRPPARQRRSLRCSKSSA